MEDDQRPRPKLIDVMANGYEDEEGYIKEARAYIYTKRPTLPPRKNLLFLQNKARSKEAKALLKEINSLYAEGRLRTLVVQGEEK